VKDRVSHEIVTIDETILVDAPRDRVWEVVSEVDKDREYWDGLTSIRNLHSEGNAVEREVTVGFIGRTGLQSIELKPKKSVELKMTKGPLKGSREIRLTSLQGGRKTRVDVSWSFEFSGVPDFAKPYVKSQLQRGTREALARIALVAEVGRHATIRPTGGERRLE
jgi:hypothetical protein